MNVNFLSILGNSDLSYKPIITAGDGWGEEMDIKMMRWGEEMDIKMKRSRLIFTALSSPLPSVMSQPPPAKRQSTKFFILRRKKS